MILTTYLALTGVGVSFWLIGHFFRMTGVAAIGAILVLAIGGAVVATGLFVPSGQSVETTYDNESGTLVENTSNEVPQYRENALTREFGGAGPLSLGGLQMLVGGLLLTQHLRAVSFD